MYFTDTQHAVVATDRRRRFEADASRHRILSAVRRHRPTATGSTSPVARPSISRGRTPSGIDGTLAA